MRQSTLFRHLALLTTAERNQFKKWLASPFHNQREDLRHLYAHILKHTSCQPELLTKARTWAVLFPDQAYGEAKMNLLLSLLLQVLRDFLAWREWQADGPQPRIHYLRALRKGGLDAEFERELQEIQTALESDPCRDEAYHQLCCQLQREKYDQLSVRQRAVHFPLEPMAKHRLLAFQLGQLRLQCTQAVVRSVSPNEANNALLFDAVAVPERPEDPGLLLYVRLLAALRDLDEAAFFEAKRLIMAHWGRFRENERRDLYLLALNVCIRKINSGHPAFLREAFDLYRDGLENRALFVNGTLSRFTYKNVTTAGILSGEKAWVRQFLEDYKPYLHPRERQQTYLYNLAVYYFRLPDYDAALDLLREANFGDDSLTNLDARSMLLRIYYERGHVEALESLLDSFGAYLRRRSDIGYQKINYDNLLRFVRQMLRKWPLDAPEKALLRQEVENTAAVAEREWLLGQLGRR